MRSASLSLYATDFSVCSVRLVIIWSIIFYPEGSRSRKERVWKGASWGNSGIWLGCLVGASLRRSSRQVQLGGDPGVDQELAGIKYLIWPRNASGSPSRISTPFPANISPVHISCQRRRRLYAVATAWSIWPTNFFVHMMRRRVSSAISYTLPLHLWKKGTDYGESTNGSTLTVREPDDRWLKSLTVQWLGAAVRATIAPHSPLYTAQLKKPDKAQI